MPHEHAAPQLSRCCGAPRIHGLAAHMGGHRDLRARVPCYCDRALARSARARANGGAVETRAVPVTRGGNGVRWISIGLLLSAVPLIVTFVWTMVALASSSGPPSQTSVTLDVTPRQWWWEVPFASDKPSEAFSTANEIHIPVGVPVLVRLHGADVIHSFWVPEADWQDRRHSRSNQSELDASGLAGPLSRTVRRVLRLSACANGVRSRRSAAGRIRPMAGTTTEGAPPPQAEAAQRGLQLVEFRCGACHSVRGTSAGARSAPDLTHLTESAHHRRGHLAQQRRQSRRLDPEIRRA